MFRRAPTSALLQRVEKHIDRLDQVLRDSEDLLAAIQRGDREDWIRELQNRLDAYASQAVSDAALLDGAAASWTSRARLEPVALSTLLTTLVVPSVYLLIGGFSRPANYTANLLDRLREKEEAGEHAGPHGGHGRPVVEPAE